MVKINNYIQPALFILFFLILIFLFSLSTPLNSILNIKFTALNEKVESVVTIYINVLPKDIAQAVINSFIALRENAIARNIASTILLLNFPTAILITAKSLIDTIVAILKLSNSPTLTARIFYPLINYLKIEKGEKPWGVVYDAITKKPIDPVLVSISTHENGVGEFTQTRVTDIQGRFSFLVTPGRYILKAEKTNYSFPSKMIKSTTDGNFKNVYHGEVIEVENPYIINLNIPMDPLSFDWNQSIKLPDQNDILMFTNQKGRSTLIITGAISSLISYILLPMALNLILIFVYLFNFLFVKTNIQRKMWGIVYNKTTKEIVPRVEIKAINKAFNVTMANTTTDHMGRYFLLLSQGTYTIKVETPAKENEKPQILAQIDNVTVNKKKQIINFDIWV